MGLKNSKKVDRTLEAGQVKGVASSDDLGSVKVKCVAFFMKKELILNILSLTAKFLRGRLLPPKCVASILLKNL